MNRPLNDARKNVARVLFYFAFSVVCLIRTCTPCSRVRPHLCESVLFLISCLRSACADEDL